MLSALEAALASGADPGPAMTEVVQRARAADPAGKRALLLSFDAVLRRLPRARTGQAAMLAGALIELGAEPRDFPLAVFDLLAALLESVPEAEDGDEPYALPDEYWDLERAAMACLARSAELRRTLPQIAAMRTRLKRYSERYGFLGKMVQVLDDELLLVLHPGTRRGFRVRIGGIADNFQLHALLLGALAGQGDEQIEGKAPAPDVVAAAAEGPAVTGSMGSRWQLAQWFALRPGGLIAGYEDTKGWIWNEGVPADIDAFEGTRVVLIGPSAMSRGWNAGRVFPHMPGRLSIEGRLTAAEADPLLERMLTSTASTATQN